MDYRIVVDTGGDFTPEMAKEMGIDLLPIIINDGENEYRDGIDITPSVLYQRMEAGEEFKTSQIPLVSYMECFERHAKEGNRVIYFQISAKLTKTGETARLAVKAIKEKYPDFDITVLDSKSAAAGEVLIIKELLRRKDEFKTKEEAVKYIEFLISKVQHLFSVDDLKYLYRGGRLSKLGYIIGGALNIKPILHVDEEGALKSLTKIRGTKNLITKLADIFDEEMAGVDLSKSLISIIYGANTDLSDMLEEELTSRHGKLNCLRTQLSATIGVHTGPELLGLIYLRMNPEDYVK